MTGYPDMPNTTKKKDVRKIVKKMPREKRKQPKVKGEDMNEIAARLLKIVDRNEKAKIGQTEFFIEYRNVRVAIKKSANAWWTDPQKLEDFCQALRIGGEILEACAYAGISEGQWEYFKKQHPDFSELRVVLQEWAVMRLRQTAFIGASKDAKLAMEMLQLTRPKQFNKRINLHQSGAIGKDITDNDGAIADEADAASENILDLLPDAFDEE